MASITMFLGDLAGDALRLARRGRAGVFGLLGMLAGCTGVPNGITPAQPFDAGRYLGPWYEVMRLDHGFERDLSDVTATYGLRPDGKISVVNKGYDTKACRWRSIEGYATFQKGPEVPSLSVTFFWPLAGGYHVFALDQTDYGYALVSGPTRDYLWILARKPDLDPAIRASLVDIARQNGFAVDELILVDHQGPVCKTAKAG
ncbi:lipocalin [Rhodospirillum rubrum]|uniref:lipocalin family protein n=1 Tax=Rhodospirillum rubrum TaxID=1085 RepID=UPI001908426C|nr:lipocalin family protein [Rhodospirillum rubrum]MBK1663815.1 lipocalin [Rhodospirillum rubrum]MBK1675846.1 lipocalin [Rhodospirillum rubrum]